ncbi:hypothetical protein IGI04_008522 [Brassica rapa subsp. trilocularis]|uniref:NAC domain-containing protein n=1 Tax=Brassica rapa subsp. trilocularis TaxID=1813537 RepID=A0ABQ7NMW2_BRACM|nr:hypothetical protein IGI04_008522 [Brassica rapa subsp. trilocularis]
MESFCEFQKEEEQIDLPPGFRFHPTDEELITQYLHKKVLDISFSAKAVGEVDFNKSEPWELPWMAKMGEKECPVLNSIQADIFHMIPLYQSPMLAQERSVLQAMVDNNTRQSLKAMSVSQETAVSTDMNTDTSSDFEYGKRQLSAQEDPYSSTGLVDLEPFWNY